jgi:hypothetical protein
MATKVYTSGEFKRERDNFLSLCKNLERADTKRWLSEVRLNIVFALFGRETTRALLPCRGCRVAI